MRRTYHFCLNKLALCARGNYYFSKLPRERTEWAEEEIKNGLDKTGNRIGKDDISKILEFLTNLGAKDQHIFKFL